MERRIVFAGAALLVAAGVWMTLAGTGPAPHTEAKAESAEPVVVEIFTAQMVSTPKTLEATGDVRPELEAMLATRVVGRVMEVPVRVGDTVRRGQPLVRMDERDLAAQVDQARENLRTAGVGYDSARTAAEMEAAMSEARVAKAQAGVNQAEAALKAAKAQREMVQTGPRRQERAQAGLQVAQAKANLTLAENNLRRMEQLFHQGAVPRQQLEAMQTAHEVAKAQFDAAREAQSMVEEGSRTEEIRRAEEGVRQAEAALGLARAELRTARAAALQTRMRRQEVRGAQARIGQSNAALRMAEVSRSYAAVNAPFDGVVAERMVDPGAIAAPGVPLLKLQGGRLRLSAVVPESSLRFLRKGAEMEVRLDALRDRVILGRVSEMAPQGDPASHTFLVKVDLPPNSGAKAGMFGRALISVGTERSLLAPRSAVRERGGLNYLFVVDEKGAARLRMVTLGKPVGDRVPVLSGLAEGERIAMGEGLKDGVTVQAGR